MLRQNFLLMCEKTLNGWCMKSESNWHIYRPQRSWAKVMFLQASVILSTGGRVSAFACWDTTLPLEQTPPGSRHHPPPEQTPPQAQTPSPEPDPLPRTRPPPQNQTPPGSRRQHTVNERPVRILLECILVSSINTLITVPTNISWGVISHNCLLYYTVSLLCRLGTFCGVIFHRLLLFCQWEDIFSNTKCFWI